MFRRLLIANRGEVAARILRTCKRLGIDAVAVASEADRELSWLSGATQTAFIGGAPASESYLDQDALIEVARHFHCSAVHPGWGFLAENHVFAARCRDVGLEFVGPDPAHMRQLGDKVLARRTMSDLGLPTIPGTHEAFLNVAQAQEAAKQTGFPVLLKAVAGGGGRGMRKAEGPEDVEAAFTEATAESEASFGDGRLYLERMIEGGRHVEVQFVADRFGRVHTLGERECSLQRRHQKVLEESPSPGLSAKERARILPMVSDAIARIGYTNAGTMEMLLDPEGKMWFMELNARLQVEHAVTEAVSGVDLVEWQLRVAANERLPADDVALKGHAIEFRINAEDPAEDFRPSPGRVKELRLPTGDGIRVDTHLKKGDRIPPNYDSMIAKLIVSGKNRAEAIQRAKDALEQFVVQGVKTNLDLHRRILAWDAFNQGEYHTRSLESFISEADIGQA